MTVETQVYFNKFNNLWCFKCSWCGECGGNYLTYELAKRYALAHSTLTH